MILITPDDPSGAKKFFAGFYVDNSLCWTAHEHIAVDKRLDELKIIVELYGLEAYTIRERVSANPVFSIPKKS